MYKNPGPVQVLWMDSLAREQNSFWMGKHVNLSANVCISVVKLALLELTDKEMSI